MTASAHHQEDCTSERTTRKISNRPLHVALLSNLYPPDVLGGYELLAHDVADRLRERGHLVHVLTTGEVRRDEPLVSRIFALSRPFTEPASKDRARHYWAAFRNTMVLRDWLRTNGHPDCVLVFSLRRLGLSPVRELQKRQIPIVFTVNDDWPVAFAQERRRSLGALLDRALERCFQSPHQWGGIHANRVVYLTENIREVARRSGAPLPNGRIQPQGLACEWIPVRPFRPIQREPHLLFLGRLHPTKAPEVAIETIASLHQRGVFARLSMVGAPVNEAYGASLRALSEELHVASHIHWHGSMPRNAAIDFIGQTDGLLFLNRGDIEAQGLTYLEAMARGVLVFAVPGGGAREILDCYGACVRPELLHGESIAKSICDVMNEVDTQMRLVNEGLHLARKVLSLDSYVDALEEELIAGVRTRT